MTLRVSSLVTISVLAAASAVWAQDAVEVAYVAGTNPSQRPATAPVIEEFVKTAEWYDEALTGVSQPYPASLSFLEDQGAWFNPFIHPGMTGHYDIRGWHNAE